MFYKGAMVGFCSIYRILSALFSSVKQLSGTQSPSMMILPYLHNIIMQNQVNPQ